MLSGMSEACAQFETPAEQTGEARAQEWSIRNVFLPSVNASNIATASSTCITRLAALELVDADVCMSRSGTQSNTVSTHTRPTRPVALDRTLTISPL
mmetsp:Transcript_6017/g.9129  ORF Transcript_6017/g.9129 Transcript_6017/m.9129 type:complete len:97 (+) Transcript_6017:1532-1822(+)